MFGAMKRDVSQKYSRLVSGEAWETAFGEYVVNRGSKFDQIKNRILEQRFTVKDSGASHRLINHWSEMGIIDDSSRENGQGWRKLSVVDLIWVHILMELRRFGMPLENLKLAYKSTFYSPTKRKTRWPVLEVAILRCLQRNPIYLIVFEDGWCEYLFSNDYYLNMQTGVLSEKAYLVVNLNKCVKEVFPKLNAPEHEISLDLSENELSVIEKLRHGDLAELHIKLKDGDIKSLINIYSGNDDYQGLIDKIEHGEYTVKRQNGKTVFTEVSEYQRVKS